MTKLHNNNLDESDATYNHVLKYTGLFGGTQGLIMLVSLVRNKISSELLGRSGLGLVSMFNNVLGLSNQVCNLGISFSAVKCVAELANCNESTRFYEVVRSVRVWSVMMGLIGMLLLLSFCNTVSIVTFGDEHYSWAIAALSPVVAMMSIQLGEMAILKGLKKLKSVALVSVFSALLVLACTVPFYLIWRMDGIVPALFLSNLTVLAVTLVYGHRAVPWNWCFFNRKGFAVGLPMLKLGFGYLLAGVMGQGADYVIRKMILSYGSIEDVGLYNSGYVLAVTYAGMVFVAIEADFFPRLSSANSNVRKCNAIINQQIEVCVLLIAPALIAFVIAMPFLLPLLFSSGFTAAVPMAVCAIGYMFFKALSLPAAYLPLSRGDSMVYMSTELLYDVFVAFAVPQAFRQWGLEGAGSALTVAGLFYCLVIHLAYRRIYSFKFNFAKAPFYMLQGALLALAVYASCSSLHFLIKCLLGAVAFGVSLYITLYHIRKQTGASGLMRNVLHRLWGKMLKLYHAIVGQK